MKHIQYTRGPWFFKRVKGYQYEIYANDGKDNNLIAITTDKRKNSVYNARIMAAAPDLLEVLEAVISITDRNNTIFDRAKETIAKARGEYGYN